MKIEEAKALFMAQHLYQKVWLRHPQIDKNPLRLSIAIFENYDDTDAHLLLRSVQDLTDEHLRILIVNRGYDPETYDKGEFKGWRNLIIDQHDNGMSRKGYDLGMEDAALLRQWGYLLKFTYLDENKPVILSCEELIQLGWVKLLKIKTD